MCGVLASVATRSCTSWEGRSSKKESKQMWKLELDVRASMYRNEILIDTAA